MLPIAPACALDARAYESGDDQREVDRIGRQREPDDHERASRADERPKSAQPLCRVDVVQHGDRSDDIERLGLERVFKEVGAYELRRLGPFGRRACSLDTRLVYVDPDDVEAAVRKVERQHPVAAADVERAPVVSTDRVEHDVVIVEVQVPSSHRPTHANRRHELTIGGDVMTPVGVLAQNRLVRSVARMHPPSLLAQLLAACGAELLVQVGDATIPIGLDDADLDGGDLAGTPTAPWSDEERGRMLVAALEVSEVIARSR